MKKQFPETIMNQSLESLDLSPKLKAIAEMYGYHTLSDLARQETSKLEKHLGFNQHMIYEYVNFMEANGLGKYVDPD